MKKAFFGFFFLLLVSLAIYGYLFCYFESGPEKLVIVKDKKEGKVLKSYRQKNVFAYEGLLFWLYENKVIKTGFSDDFTAEVPLAKLAGVQSVKNSIKIPVTLKYSLIKDTFDDISLLDGEGERLTRLLRNRVVALLKKKVTPFVSPVYRGARLKGEMQKLLEEAEAELQESLAFYKIRFTALESASPADIPDYAEYQRGLQYAAELRALSFENRKALEKLKQRLKEEKLREGALYDRYRQMAAIIKVNPEILKYIYIDKISDDLKVIISSDRTGFPLFLDREKKEKPVNKTGEIDNLR